MRTILSLGLIAMASVAAEAKDQPVMFPTRDVVVQSATMVAGQSFETQVSYLASERKMLIPLQKRSGMYVLTDIDAHISITIFPGTPPTYLAQQNPDEKQEFLETGEKETIAGYECEVWRTVPIVRKFPGVGASAGTGSVTQSSTHCITADGIVLRTIIDSISGGVQNRVTVTATNVIYGPLDPALFRIPPGAVRK